MQAGKVNFSVNGEKGPYWGKWEQSPMKQPVSRLANVSDSSKLLLKQVGNLILYMVACGLINMWCNYIGN